MSCSSSEPLDLHALLARSDILLDGAGMTSPPGQPKPLLFRLPDDGVYPNNRLPLVLYAAAFDLAANDPASVIEKVFRLNKWTGHWRNGIYTYHHYHSTAHEVLGVFSGSAHVQFGGDRGITQHLQPGDVVVIPAGVAHKNLGGNDAFGVVGAYPQGQHWDLNYGKPGERPKTEENITRVPLPKSDPVYGSAGPLVELWTRA